MLVIAIEGSTGHACDSWAELVRKCGYKAEVAKQPQGDLEVEIKPDNTYSKLVPPFKRLYSDEYGEKEAIEDLCNEFAKKFMSKHWYIVEVHKCHAWSGGKQVVRSLCG